MAEKLKVTLIKSPIGAVPKNAKTVAALGLHKIGDASVQPDSPATQGKIRKLSHLIEVSEAKQGGAN